MSSMYNMSLYLYLSLSLSLSLSLTPFLSLFPFLSPSLSLSTIFILNIFIYFYYKAHISISKQLKIYFESSFFFMVNEIIDFFIFKGKLERNSNVQILRPHKNQTLDLGSTCYERTGVYFRYVLEMVYFYWKP